MHVEGLIPGIFASVQLIAILSCLKIFSNFSSYSGCKSLAIMTGNFSFGAKNACFRFSSSGLSYKVGGASMEGANLGTVFASLASVLAICENSYTTTSSYPMGSKESTKLVELA